MLGLQLRLGPRGRYHRPGYFKWTQWIFLQPSRHLVRRRRRKGPADRRAADPRDGDVDAGERRYVIDSHRLAYQAEVPVNWCPALGTVLANEEVIDGKSERGGPPGRAPAAAAVAAADHRLRRAAAGRPEHARLVRVDQGDAARTGSARARARRSISGRGRTRRSTILRLHDAARTRCSARRTWCCRRSIALVDDDHHAGAADGGEGRTAQAAARKSDLERTELAKKKTGVFTGAYAINPAERERRFPIWIADYVLASYGTGAIMAVPGARRARLVEFARNVSVCPIRRSGRSRRAGHVSAGGGSFTSATGVAINSGFLNGLPTAAGQAEDHRLAGGEEPRPADGQLQAARLAVQPAALLGRAVPGPARRERSDGATDDRPSAIRCR